MEDDPLIGLLLLQLFFILLNAVFACAEIAVLSVNEVKLNKLAAEGDKRAARLSRLTSQPARFLATIQISITLAGFLGSAFAADNFADRLVEAVQSTGVNINAHLLNSISVVVITLILSFFTLVFGELVPKRLAMKKAESIALALSGVISFISAAFRPIVWLLTVSTNLVLKLLGVDPNEEDDELTEDEIRMMIDAGSEKGAIEEGEKELLQNVFDTYPQDNGGYALDRGNGRGMGNHDKGDQPFALSRLRGHCGRCCWRAEGARLFEAYRPHARKRYEKRRKPRAVRAAER